MRFGLLAIGHHDLETPPDENFEKILGQIGAADRAGFDLVWAG